MVRIFYFTVKMALFFLGLFYLVVEVWLVDSIFVERKDIEISLVV